MKLKYRNCLAALEKHLGKKPTHAEISKIISISANALSNRFSNDGYLKDDEIEKIEKSFKINLTQIPSNVEIEYYCDFFHSKKSEKISVSKKCFDNFKEDKNYIALRVIGDGMSPYIENSDKVIIEEWENEQIRDNNVYLFKFKDEFFIKRLTKNINQIIVKSDNKNYPIRFIEKEEVNFIEIVGQIVGLIRDVD